MREIVSVETIPIRRRITGNYANAYAAKHLLIGFHRISQMKHELWFVDEVYACIFINKIFEIEMWSFSFVISSIRQRQIKIGWTINNNYRRCFLGDAVFCFAANNNSFLIDIISFDELSLDI